MLVNFSVENYKSIYERLDLSFTAESLKQHEEENLIKTDFPKVNLLKSLALFGANASGKTNLIKALEFMREFVLNSSLNYRPNKTISVEPYKLLIKSQNEPTSFEIDFISFETRYRYGFTVSKHTVHHEYLYQVLKTTEKLLFERTEDEIEFGQSFSEGYGKNSFVRTTSLFLSTLAQLNGTISLNIVTWFDNLKIITDYNYPLYTGYTAELIKQKGQSEFLMKVFKAAGLDFEGVNVRTVNIDDNLTQFLSSNLQELVKKNIPHQLQVFTTHKVFDTNGQEVDSIDFDLKEESAGTQKFFAIAGPIVNSLLNGYPIVIDELDAKLHFKLVHFILELFNSKRHNRYGGQLVYSNHMINSMDNKLLRRDQILMVSKTKVGTKIISIHQKGARSDKSFTNDYLSGEFGALPDIQFNQLDLFD